MINQHARMNVGCIVIFLLIIFCGLENLCNFAPTTIITNNIKDSSFARFCKTSD